MIRKSSKGLAVALLYRRLFHRRGHRVHSPFVFNLITRVIEEKSLYYSYDDIELERKKLFYRKENKKQICHWIKPKYGRLLFRLTNHFKTQSILYVAAADPICLAYLTSYRKGVKCKEIVSVENLLELQTISCLFDFVYWDLSFVQPDKGDIYTLCKDLVSDKTVFVLKGIYLNRKTRAYWKEICNHPQVAVTLDLYSFGIIILNKKLHKRTYKVHF